MRRKEQVAKDDELFKTWSEWVKTIYDETVALAHNRQMFRRIAQIFEGNKRLQKEGGHVWDWLRRNYAAAAAMSLRRELDKQARTINLRQLLEDIQSRPTVISRARHRAMWPLDGADKKVQEFQADLRERSFNRLQLIKDPDDDDWDHIDPSMFEKDRKELTAETEKVRAYVEQVFAHRTGKQSATVTFDEFDVAVDAVQKMVKKYYLLLMQTSVVRFEPAPQFDIDAPFRFAWLPAKRRRRTPK